MPQLLALPIHAFLLTATAIAAPLTGPLAIAISSTLFYAGLSLAGSALSSLFASKPQVPRPEDGNFNLRQLVPSLPIILGRARTGGDYLFLEEVSGTAVHILCHAGHRIQGYVTHYLHDEVVTLDGSGFTTSPAHFGDNVQILVRLGLPTETAYADVITKFPAIWTAEHRGDGLSTVRMSCASVNADAYQSTYPNQSPQHSAVIDGALVYDPRDIGQDPADPDTWAFANNLALLRLHHLTQPWGGKLALSDMYLPDWIVAADVCDQSVLNRDGDSEPRYHGGLRFRANSDQIAVGRLLDQAAEMVVHERADGLVGVHAGQMVEPTLRLTAADILSLSYRANQSVAATVLAVRGRFTDPQQGFATVDAAIVGDPYVGEDTERTRTLDNQAVQSHNHIQRLQAIAKIRANAPRVSIRTTYQAASEISQHRFVRIFYPPRLNDAIVEITSTPKLSFSSMTVEFSGIVVPASLYTFDAATDEGEPPTRPEALAPSAVPVPTGFDVVITTEVVSGGQTAAFAVAEWAFVSDALLYEIEWQATEGPNQTPVSSVSRAGENSVRTGYLADGLEHRFRLRTWSNGAASDWTAYEYRTATADPVAPGIVTSPTLTGGTGQVTFAWTAPNSANYFAARLYLNTSNTFAGSTLMATEYGAPAAADSRVITGVAAGTIYGFIEAINSSGVPAAAQATGAATVL